MNKEVKKIVQDNFKEILAESLYKNIVDFLERQKKNYDRNTAIYMVIEKAIREGNNAETFLKNLLAKAKSLPPFDNLKGERGLEKTKAGLISTQINNLLDKWLETKSFFGIA